MIHYPYHKVMPDACKDLPMFTFRLLLLVLLLCTTEKSLTSSICVTLPLDIYKHLSDPPWVFSSGWTDSQYSAFPHPWDTPGPLSSLWLSAGLLPGDPCLFELGSPELGTVQGGGPPPLNCWPCSFTALQDTIYLGHKRSDTHITLPSPFWHEYRMLTGTGRWFSQINRWVPSTFYCPGDGKLIIIEGHGNQKSAWCSTHQWSRLSSWWQSLPEMFRYVVPSSCNISSFHVCCKWEQLFL